MKKLLIFLFTVISFAALGQAGAIQQSGIFLRVNDTTTYQTAAAAKHSAGYYDIYFNNQATTPHFDIWNGSSYDHVFDFNAGGGLTPPIDATDIADGSVTDTEFQYINTLSSNAQTQIDGKQAAFGSQSANTVYAGPTSGGAATPAFRALVTEDLSGALTANRTVTTASATIQADNLNIVYLDAASPEDFTIDQLTDDSQVILVNKGAATWTLIDGVGVTSSGSTTVESGEMAVIIYDTSTEPIVFGGGSAVALADITGLGTGVATALAVNVGSAGAVVVNGGALGTPSSGTATNLTGLPVSTGIAGLGSNVATWLATPSYTNFLAAVTGTSPYYLLASGGAMTANNTLSGNFGFTMTGTFTGGSDVTPIRANYINRSVTQTGSATNKEADIETIEGLLTASGTGVTQRLFGLTIKPTQSGATGYFGWIRGYDPVASNDAFRFGKPQASPTSTANNFEFLGGTSGATSLTLQVASGSITSTASSSANLVYRGGTGTSNLLDFGFGTTSVAAVRPAADISNGRGFSIRQDGANATGTASQRSSFAEIFEGSFWTGATEQTRRSYIVQEADASTNGLAWLRTYAGLNFGYATVIQSMNLTNGNVGYGVAAPTAMVHLPASTTAANTASLKINEGSRQTSAEDGTINYVANNLEFVETSTVHILAKTLTGTGTLNFGSIASLGNEILTITVTGAADGDVVSIGVPNGSMTAGLVFTSWVSASNTVSVQCYNSTVGAIDPASGTFRASVTKY